jgi:hypothetical protein
MSKPETPDGSECRITYSRCASAEVDDVRREEVARARSGDDTLGVEGLRP